MIEKVVKYVPLSMFVCGCLVGWSGGWVLVWVSVVCIYGGCFQNLIIIHALITIRMPTEFNIETVTNIDLLSEMTTAEINSQQSGFQLNLGTRIVTEIHYRLGVEINPKFWSG